MKNRLVIIIIVIIVLLVLLLLYIFNGKVFKKVEIKKIKYFSFGYSTGTMINSQVNYQLTCKERCLISVKPNQVCSDDPTVVEVDEEFEKKLEDILVKYNVGSWNGFQKSDPGVLDGNSFNLSVSMEDNQHISASGYMMYPNNYREFVKEVGELFEPFYNPDSKEKTKVIVNDIECDFVLEDNEAAKEFISLFPQEYELIVEDYRRMRKELDIELPLDDKEWYYVNRGDVLLKDGKNLIILADDYMEHGLYTKIGHINEFPRINGGKYKIQFLTDKSE